MTVKEIKAELNKLDDDLYGDEEVVFYNGNNLIFGIEKINGAVLNTTGDYDIERIVIFPKWADDIFIDYMTEWR